jgi:hypothetical protein
LNLWDREGDIVIFPDILTVTVVDLDTGCPVSEVALVLVLKAQRKNDYTVGPIITDQHGLARFTRNACENTIAVSQKTFIMDYFGDLLSCGPVAEIRLHPPKSIAVMIDNYGHSPEFWGVAFKEPEKIFAALRRVRNSLYEPANLPVKSSDILSHPEVKFFLKRKE